MADHTRTASMGNPAVTAAAADPAATTGGLGEGTIGETPSAPAQRYELGDEIARGGMGVVYRATDTAFGREVAVKVLLDKYAPTSGTARRFADEARITGQLQHPNIPAVHDLGTLPDGRPFLAMKLIKGQTLDDALKARTDLSADRGNDVAVFEAICQAVGYAHAHGVIHRDLKPANVMVGAYGEVQVMDWGLAKQLRSAEFGTRNPDQDPEATADLSPTPHSSLHIPHSDLTQAGSVLGTPAFMPPEQAIGAVNIIDRRSDVFGLGGILSVILTGQPPFVSTSAETTRVKAATGDVADCFAKLDGCGADPELVALCKRCLSPKPGDRPADAGEVARAVAALRAAADERARQAELETVRVEGARQKAELQAAEQRKRRRVQLALAGLVLLVAVGGGIAAVLVQRQREQDRSAGEKQLDEATRQKERETRAASLVESLGGADTPSVPRIIADLADLRDLARPKLDEMLANATPGSKEHLHASLALLPVDPGQVEYLFGRLLGAKPNETPVICEALLPHKDSLLDKLWFILEKPERSQEAKRLRAAAALATFDAGNDRWAKVAEAVVHQLVAENPIFLGVWLEQFRPIKRTLLMHLYHTYMNKTRRESELSLATSILADYAADNPPVLANLLMDADEKQFPVIYAKFMEQGDKGLPLLTGEIDKALPPDLPSSDGKREALAKRQANAAVTLLRLNQPAKVWPLLKHGPDPRVRSYLIHRLSPLGADAGAVVKQLDEEKDITIRRALLLSLGEFKEADFTPDERQAVLPKVQEVYRTANDPGLHAASEWLLRTCKQEAWLTRVNAEWAMDREGRDKKLAGIKELVTKDKEKAPPQWYVNGQAQTMVVIPGPVEFVMGSPKTEENREEREPQHKRRIGRSFALASKSVSLAEYRSLTKDKYEIGEKSTYSPDLPVVGINWYMAAKYCNLLSKEEGVPEEQWCYETGANGQVTKLRENYLSLSGYRLPTEAEMEYATRAGAGTSRYYGETDELLTHYAWYARNAGDLLRRVGLKKPNEFGLFDAQGNCFTWCQEPYGEYPKADSEGAVEDKVFGKGSLSIDGSSSHVLRGGSFLHQPSLVRCSYRSPDVPTTRYTTNGFRVARTFTP